MGRTTKKKPATTAVTKKEHGNSKFSKEVEERILQCAKLGMTDVEISEIVGITDVTLRSWKKKNRSFLMALKMAKWEHDQEVEDSLRKRAVGYVMPEQKVLSFNGEHTETVTIQKHHPPDPTSMIFWLKNRQPQKWRDKVHVEQQSQHTIVLDAGSHGNKKFPI